MVIMCVCIQIQIQRRFIVMTILFINCHFFNKSKHQNPIYHKIKDTHRSIHINYPVHFNLIYSVSNYKSCTHVCESRSSSIVTLLLLHYLVLHCGVLDRFLCILLSFGLLKFVFGKLWLRCVWVRAVSVSTIWCIYAFRIVAFSCCWNYLVLLLIYYFLKATCLSSK